MKQKSLFIYMSLLTLFANQSIYATTDSDYTDEIPGFTPLPPTSPVDAIGPSDYTDTIPNFTPLPLSPQATIWGFTGSHTVGKGQMMFPVVGDMDRLWYMMAEGSAIANDGDWMVGLGSGYRQVVQNKILGGYLIGDYNFTDGSNKYLVLNPGLESLGAIWDIRTNGYFPCGSKERITQNAIGWESDIGNYSYVTPSGHDWSDHQYQEIDYLRLGNGMDVEFGRLFKNLNNLKAYLGGYFFDIKNDSSITGIEGRVNYPMSTYVSLEARDSYDNDKHNTFLLGFRLKLGGFNNENSDTLGISARLLDPIEHNIAASDQGGSVPAKKNSEIQDLGQLVTRYDDVQYVDSDSPDGGDGTYENPYNELNDDTMTAIETSSLGSTAHIFVENEDSTYDLGTSTLIVPEDYSIWGFENDFRTLASGDDRPILAGSMQLLGDNSLSSFQLEDYTSATGITIGDGTNYADNVYMDNMLIDVGNTTASSTSSITAIVVNNGELTFADNNTVNAFTNSTSSSVSATGISATNNSTIDIDGNNNTITASNTGYYDSNVIKLDDSILNINGDNNSILGDAIRWSNGIAEYNGSAININGDNNLISGTNTGVAWGATGVYVDDSQLNITGDNNAIQCLTVVGTQTAGISATGNSVINISGDNNVISAESPDDVSNSNWVTGIYLDGNSTLNITGNDNTISASGDVVGNIDSAIYLTGGSSNTQRVNITGQGTTLDDYNYGGAAYGVYAADLSASSSISIANTTFDVAAIDGDVYGLYLDSSTAFNPNINLTISNSVFDIQSQDSYVAYGIYNATGTTFTSNQFNTLLNDNTFSGNIQSGNEVYSIP